MGLKCGLVMGRPQRETRAPTFGETRWGKFQRERCTQRKPYIHILYING